jgi:NAD(P)-dependent dehydrogenase (short-subunit alcohol dehydrogenase family)
MVAINLRSRLLTSKNGLTHVRKSGEDIIINTSFLALTKPFTLISHKNAKTKGIALSEQFAERNAVYGIRTNVIFSYLINTPPWLKEGFDRANRGMKSSQSAKALVPLGRKMGTAWDVAHAMAFLASDKASYIVGVSLTVEDGLSVV